jgi:hypothetical protein
LLKKFSEKSFITFYFFANFQLAFHARLIAICGHEEWLIRARENHFVVMQLFDEMSKTIEIVDGGEVNEQARSARRELVLSLNVQNQEFMNTVLYNYGV